LPLTVNFEFAHVWLIAIVVLLFKKRQVPVLTFMLMAFFCVLDAKSGFLNPPHRAKSPAGKVPGRALPFIQLTSHREDILPVFIKVINGECMVYRNCIIYVVNQHVGYI